MNGKDDKGRRAGDLDPALLEHFEAWRRETGKPSQPEPEEEGPPPEDPLRRATRVRRLRQTALLVVLVVCAVSAWITRSEVAYFLEPSVPRDLGNVRQSFIAGDTVLDVPTNRHVRVEGLVITVEASNPKYNYFFCPLYKIVVRTPRPLPEKARPDRYFITIEPEWEPILSQRLALPHDLTVSFEAQGRLLRLSEAPGWADDIIEFYGTSLDLPEEGTRADQKRALEHSYLLLDGVVPSDKSWYLALYAMAAALVALTVVLYVRALRAERRLLRDRHESLAG